MTPNKLWIGAFFAPGDGQWREATKRDKLAIKLIKHELVLWFKFARMGLHLTQFFIRECYSFFDDNSPDCWYLLMFLVSSDSPENALSNGISIILIAYDRGKLWMAHELHLKAKEQCQFFGHRS